MYEDPGELKSRLREIGLLSSLKDEQLDWLLTVGELRQLNDGDVIIQDGEQATNLYVLLSGELVVTKNMAGHEEVMTRHVAQTCPDDSPRARPSLHEFTGELPLLTDGINVATVKASGHATVFSLCKEAFFDLLARYPDVLRVLLPTLAWRVRSLEIRAREQATISALSTLAAGLAHELNNPVAAIVRGAGDLGTGISRLAATAECWGRLAAPPDREALVSAIAEVVDAEGADARSSGAVGDTDDMIDEVLDWARAARAQDPQQLACVLAEHEIGGDWMGRRLGSISPAALPAALDHLCAAVECHDLVSEIRAAVSRITQLVAAAGEYANLDRAVQREISVHEELDATLAMMSVQLTGLRIVRTYHPGTPKMTGYPSELNQVWTNLLKNAAEAMNGAGTLTVTVASVDGHIAVEIADTGCGISTDSITKIFQPFYTTKDVGKGTGLGLHTAHRIVTQRHGGSIDVQSSAGDTRFTVRLPLAR
jgi:signal transduction histidine kinase